MNKESLMQFPCLFPIKVMGINQSALISEVVAIISSYCRDFKPDVDITIKPSRKGNYISITATIVAQSQEQLDNIYIALNKHKLVKVTL
ncbi:MAG: YbeD family protein [Neisseriaceae bacterium]